VPLPCDASAVIGQVASRLPVVSYSEMQKTVEYTNNRVSPATVELLIRERNKGKSLRQLGHRFNRSGERIRQVLAKYDLQVTLLPENTVAANLGYPLAWLIQLRKEGIINPIKPGGFWLYSEEQVRQIPSLIAERRRCERCGELRPLGCRRFCRDCSQYRKNHRYKALSPEEKTKHIKRVAAWRKANPEKYKEIQSRAERKYQAKRLERTSYVVSRGNYLSLGTIVKVKKVKATYRSNPLIAILDNGLEIPVSCLRKVNSPSY